MLKEKPRDEIEVCKYVSYQKKTGKIVTMKDDFDMQQLIFNNLRIIITKYMPLIMTLLKKLSIYIYIKLYSLYMSHLHCI